MAKQIVATSRSEELPWFLNRLVMFLFDCHTFIEKPYFNIWVFGWCCMERFQEYLLYFENVCYVARLVNISYELTWLYCVTWVLLCSSFPVCKMLNRVVRYRISEMQSKLNLGMLKIKYNIIVCLLKASVLIDVC